MKSAAVRRTVGIVSCALGALFLIVIRGGVATSSSEEGPGARPNVLVVLIDTVRGDHVSAYGYARETSPEIDAIARDGVRFTRAYAQSNWTKPSVASLFTGLYPRHHGVVIGSAAMDEAGELKKVEKLGAYPMPDDLPLLAEAFRANGYETLGFVENSHVNETQGFGRGFDDYRRVVPAERFLRRELKRRVSDAPVFAYLHLIGPHDPYDNEKDHFGHYRDRFGKSESSVDFKDLAYKKRDDLTSADVERAVALYDAELAYYDENRFGTLMKWLRKSGQYDDWLIVVTSDHGEELYERQGWAHGHTLYEEVIRVPLVVKLPKGRTTLPPGTALDEVVELVDLFPTLTDLAGIETAHAHAHDGESLATLLRGERDVDPHAVAISEHSTHTQEQVLGAAIISRNHKLVEAYDFANALPLKIQGDRREAFFDLVRDPEEKVNLHDASPELVATLRDSLNARVGASPRIKHTTGTEMVELSDEETAHLRALGYIK